MSQSLSCDCQVSCFLGESSHVFQYHPEGDLRSHVHPEGYLRSHVFQHHPEGDLRSHVCQYHPEGDLRLHHCAEYQVFSSFDVLLRCS